jgi:MFS family permease
MRENFLKTFPAFYSKNYQLYFTGQLVSLTGTWLQEVTLGWLVFQLTHSALWVGIVASATMLPRFLFSLFGGVLVDRYRKKHILFITQTSSMVLALLLGVLTVTGAVNIHDILVISFCLGLVNALDIPARQSYVVELVGKEHLSSAIALNSGMFSAARAIGPAVAGILIAVFGAGWAFILNGLSYLPVLIALHFITTPKTHLRDTHHPIKAIKRGLHYAFTHPVIKVLLLFTGLLSIFGWSFSTLLPVVAEDVFHTDASGLGNMYVASSLGAILGAIFMSKLADKIREENIVLSGNIIFSISIIAFAYSTNYFFALFMLFITGFGLLLQYSSINTTIQKLVKDELRGRVMSIYVLMFGGLSFIGSFQAGFLAQKYGTAFAISLGGVVVFVFGLILYFQKHKILARYDRYLKSS